MSTSLQRPVRKSHNPMIEESCIKYLNFRIQQEDLSARIYLSMSMWLNNEGYSGAAALWRKYSNEEIVHADWSREYLLSMGVTPETAVLAAQPLAYAGLPDIIRKSYDHEIEVTKQIKAMASDAQKKGDHMLYELCLHYLKEQVEEHDKTQTWVDKLAAFGEDKLALRLLDDEMAG